MTRRIPRFDLLVDIAGLGEGKEGVLANFRETGLLKGVDLYFQVFVFPDDLFGVCVRVEGVH